MLRALLNRWFLPASATPAVAPTPVTFVQALGDRSVEQLAHLNRGASLADRTPVPPDPQGQVFIVCVSITSKCHAKNSDPVAEARVNYRHAEDGFRNQWFIDTAVAHVLMLFFSSALRDEQVDFDPKRFTVSFVDSCRMLYGVDLEEGVAIVLSARTAAADLIVRFSESSHPWHETYVLWHRGMSQAALEYVWTGEQRWLDRIILFHDMFMRGMWGAYLAERLHEGNPVHGFAPLAASTSPTPPAGPPAP